MPLSGGVAEVVALQPDVPPRDDLVPHLLQRVPRGHFDHVPPHPADALADRVGGVVRRGGDDDVASLNHVHLRGDSVEQHDVALHAQGGKHGRA
eukprot:CAMPEP_0174916510 /NCGR_PEP_ID=MMETSP1355-20121228/1859_1 /TAXON_ID=464990 /ORGANISM="Hemiselmis tepida, Strain CCMP443" /LENGTH=93 /DNA_ID=CAMNT_0016161519 /DNA_START=214 /DNA_END=496 /DNA_ORIENTATION=-